MSVKETLKIIPGKLFGIFKKIFLQQEIVVFVYHDVTNTPSEFILENNLNVLPDLFERQVAFIKQNFNVITPDMLVSGDLPPNPALITFDDGFKSVYENAWPILAKYNLSSTIFINMAPIEGELFWSGLLTYLCSKRADFRSFLCQNYQVDSSSPLFLSCSEQVIESYFKQVDDSFKSDIYKYVGPFMTRSDLEVASKSNLLFFGNHLFNHFVPKLMSDDDFLSAYDENRDKLVEFPNHREIFSFPFGQLHSCYSLEQVDLLKSHGVQKCFSSSGKCNSSGAAFCFDRTTLTNYHDSDSKIWYQLLRQRF